MEQGHENKDNGPWRPRLDPESRSKANGVADALEQDIRAGILRPGDRLPTQRDIARALRMDLTTITRAFNEARRRGLISATVGRGTFVNGGAILDERPRQQTERPLDLSMNIPPQPDSAALARRLPDTITRLLQSEQGRSLFGYQESGGTEADRFAGALWLAPLLGTVDLRRVVVTAGSQNALDGICACLVPAGGTIAAPVFTYPGLRAVAAARGLRLAGIAMDADGILPDALEALCAAEKPDALYLVPTIDNPTTSTLPLQRREAIVATARRYDVPIIEDDPYGMLPEPVVGPLGSLAPERTWYISALSKCVSPVLRIAYVAMPDRLAADGLAAVIRSTSLMVSPLLAAVASDWITTGLIDTITRTIRTENSERQEIAAAALGDRRYFYHPQGHHLWLPLPGGWNATAFAAEAERSGLSVVPAESFALAPSASSAVRVSLGPPADRVVLKRALDLLNALLAAGTPAPRTIV
ncbi:PLP-dependent aminotransferase family protein [Rhizobiaceae bacterium n13]|uniref:PLP-dependent aminotransferase family protein n=1 Tax=Ferirhizobium litorale TaxID=2927786 RepID=A0AAE3QCE7_9HYPH|nr:PLP-dependent aminotransferase family protein [Fererhizobium litorale]MDI7863160.1 PLP-dependent aminotransferase family protein [Fererhizobium litorale]MDI7923162.1 PLP-dependent aminotransferase family protein [Fererhizobium litorale]